MHGLEALYAVEFGDVAGLGYRNAGVAVLETGRIYGGDSGYYYLGDISIKERQFEAHLSIKKHNLAWGNVFGDDATQFDIAVVGKIDGDVIEGSMARLDKPWFALPIRLRRIATLP